MNEQTILGGLAELLGAPDFELFKKNSKSVFFEPQVGAAAYALATTLEALGMACCHNRAFAMLLPSRPRLWRRTWLRSLTNGLSFAIVCKRRQMSQRGW